MSTLIKISDIQFFMGFGTIAENTDCADCRTILNNNNVPYRLIIDIERVTYTQKFAEFSNWVFGLNFNQYTITSWPVIIWYEYYDDFNVVLNIAKNSQELQNSTLIQNTNLIQS